MNGGGENKIQNRLWLIRKRRDLKQKQVSYLLNHHNVDQISRYENGSRIPTLQAALKLEIIYGVSIRLLFPDLYAQLSGEIKQRAESSRSLMKSLTQVLAGNSCSYAELLSSLTRTNEDLEKVRRHAIDLIKAMT